MSANNTSSFEAYAEPFMHKLKSLVPHEADLYEVHEDKLAEHRGDAQKRKAVAHVEDGVLQTELLGEAVHWDDELNAICLEKKLYIYSADIYYFMMIYIETLCAHKFVTICQSQNHKTGSYNKTIRKSWALKWMYGDINQSNL